MHHRFLIPEISLTSLSRSFPSHIRTTSISEPYHITHTPPPREQRDIGARKERETGGGRLSIVDLRPPIRSAWVGGRGVILMPWHLAAGVAVTRCSAAGRRHPTKLADRVLTARAACGLKALTAPPATRGAAPWVTPARQHARHAGAAAGVPGATDAAGGGGEEGWSGQA